jgi:hypothetical protein
MLGLELSALVIRSRADGQQLLGQFPRLNKLRSWAALWALGVPTLRGVVVDEWSTSTATAVEAFAASIGSARLLVRSDAAHETGRYPRGGFEIGLEEVELVVASLTLLGRVPFLLEPRSPLADEYSLGILSWPREPLQIEVVGPGFDASDLKRGDMSPHERFSIERSPHGARSIPRVISHEVVTPSVYLQSWNDRLQKIASMLAMTEARDLSESVRPPDSEIRTRLEALGETRILRAEQGYEPISDDLVMEAIQWSEFIARNLPQLGFPGEPLVVSMSYWGPHLEPIYWDVVWPATKFEGLTIPR